MKNFDKFHNYGYKGLYKGETANDIAKRKELEDTIIILENRLKKLEENSWKGSKEDFLRYYNNAKQYKRSGVYIHKNLSNGKCYVGQSHNIFQRVKDELDGVATNKGCKALYQDYQNGYKFEITLIFKKKGYPNLHKMERAFINLHNAKTDGYNETYGNTETGETVYE